MSQFNQGGLKTLYASVAQKQSTTAINNIDVYAS
jgi:hypothetical protein